MIDDAPKAPPFMAAMRDSLQVWDTFFEIVLPEALGTRRQYSSATLRFVWVLMDRFYETETGKGGYCLDFAEQLEVATGTATAIIEFMLECGLIENKQTIGKTRLFYPTQRLLDRLSKWQIIISTQGDTK